MFIEADLADLLWGKLDSRRVAPGIERARDREVGCWLFEQMGEERTFEVDVVPPKLFEREIVRPKYRRKEDRTAAPVIAPAPPVPGG